MMVLRRTSLILAMAAVLPLLGCSSRCEKPTYRYRANLALNGNRDQALIAQAIAGRSDWPSIHAGYRFDGPTTYLDVTLDEEFSYDEFGGVFLRTRESTASGVVYR
jgi:hypothetical protein